MSRRTKLREIESVKVGRRICRSNHQSYDFVPVTLEELETDPQLLDVRIKPTTAAKPRDDG